MPEDLITSACYLLSDVNALLGLDVTNVVAPLNALIDSGVLTGAAAFFAHEKLCRAYHKLQCYDLAERTAMQVKRLKICFERQAQVRAEKWGTTKSEMPLLRCSVFCCCLFYFFFARLF